MIFYFTATGNSLDVAQAISKVTGDELIDLGRAYREQRFDYPIEQGDTLGFVIPVYAWSTPGIVDDFIRKMHLVASNGNPFVPGYCFCVFTCGMFIGKAADFLGKMLDRYQSIRLDASFSVQSVNSCVYLFNGPTEEKQQTILQKAHRQAREVAYLVDTKRMTHQEVRNPFGSLMSNLTCKENKPRSIEPFHVTLDKCTGCGICARVCPTGTIRMEKGIPVWTGGNCTQCLACLHRCPAQASQYGTHTAGRRRYLNPALKDMPIPETTTRAAYFADLVDVEAPEPEEPAPVIVEEIVAETADKDDKAQADGQDAEKDGSESATTDDSKAKASPAKAKKGTASAKAKPKGKQAANSKTASRTNTASKTRAKAKAKATQPKAPAAPKAAAKPKTSVKPEAAAKPKTKAPAEPKASAKPKALVQAKTSESKTPAKPKASAKSTAPTKSQTSADSAPTPCEASSTTKPRTAASE